MPKADVIVYNIGELVTFSKGPLRRVTPEDAVILRNSGVAIREGRIVEVGTSSYITSKYDGLAIDAGGRLVTPGLIDSHTHLVFGGSREDEFELKLSGVPYEEILRRGGGIYRTVGATRSASDEELIARAVEVLDFMLEHGTTVVEAKSGYGLTLEEELRLLRLIKTLDEIHPVKVVPTLLAHVVPEEYRERRQDYVDMFVEELIPKVAGEGLAVYVDVFCDKGVFTPEETRRILLAGLKHGLKARLHADEIDYIGCSRLAEEIVLDAVDHLEKTPPENAVILAEKGVVAGLLPTSIMALFTDARPPINAFRKAGVYMAVASDFNPNNMTPHVQLAMDVSTYILGLTPLEALAGATVNAAKSLGLDGEYGRIAPGYKADLVVWDVENYKWIGYAWGFNKVLAVVVNGRIEYPEIDEADLSR